MSILDHFPYPELRGLQEEVLLTIEAEWDEYDCFVVVAPTSSGKASLALCIAQWSQDAVIINPNNMLVEQYREKLDAPAIRGAQTYTCHTHPEHSCKQRHASCRGCPLRADRQNLASSVYVTNYHMYASQLRQNRWANAKSVCIADEAHNLVKFQRDWNSKRIWRHNWTDLKFGPLVDGANPEYVKSDGTDFWSGGGTFEGRKYTRGEAEPLECHHLVPIDVSRMTDQLWPRRTEKIVLLSATISRKDIDALGLGRRRVRYLECRHPIDPARRPVYLDYIADISSSNLEDATKQIAKHIESNLLPHHPDKGLVHVTYKQAEILRRCLSSHRFIFHTRENKSAKYAEFMDSSPEEGKVLIASGLYEGIDLPNDLGRWQVIAKCPWPNLGDAVVKHQVTNDPEYYAWLALRDVIQGAGRICRTESDYGVTYICDGTFDRLLQTDLVPEWFREALVDYFE